MLYLKHKWTMKILIIYDSKYGTTKTYAEMISKHIDAKIESITNITEADLQDADIVIIGTYVRVGAFHAKWRIKQHWKILKDKKIYLFSTSAEATKSELQAILYKTFAPEDIQHIQYFSFPGVSDYTKLTRRDKVLLRFPIHALQTKAHKGDEKAGQVAQQLKGICWHIDEESILPLIEHIRNS